MSAKASKIVPEQSGSKKEPASLHCSRSDRTVEGQLPDCFSPNNDPGGVNEPKSFLDPAFLLAKDHDPGDMSFCARFE